MLHLPDVVGQPREQLPRRPPREEGRRLPHHVPVEPISQVADHALTDVRHQVVGEVRADALQQVEADDGRRYLPHLLLMRQDDVEDALDLRGEQRRGRRVDEHRRNRPREPQAIGRRIAKQPEEDLHSVKRYFSSTQSATKPSRHVIFLPSS